MNRLSLFVLLSVLGLLVASCKKDDPYINFKDQNGKMITSQVIDVEIGTRQELYVEIGYDEDDIKQNMIYYSRQIDENPFHDLLFIEEDLTITTVGKHNNLSIEKAIIYTSIQGDDIAPGTIINIRVKDKGTLSKTITYKVK